MSVKFKNIMWLLLLLIIAPQMVHAEFVHPGLTNNKSDLDRLKYMVEAQVEPWYSSYNDMVSDSKSSYDYTVQGDESFTVLGRDDGTNLSEWKSDIRAAYYNAIRWYVTGDVRHAEKSIEIFKAWSNLQDVTSSGTRALSGAIAYIMVEAAEIIKSTYPDWSEDDIQAFSDMLVYPGYSNVEEPDGMSRTTGSFYWQAYQGDAVRHGNQGLSGFRAVMAMGIFLDNEIMYDRALRYIQGKSHRDDDMPYPPGPPEATTISAEGDYADTYNYTVGTSVEDYGYNEVMTNYIWENGQGQESSRDQSHSVFGIGILVGMAEMAWNQGDDLYGHEDDRLLLGLEYTSKYNVSYLKSYPDQEEWWEPTVESGEFIQRFNASQRVYSKSISPINIGGFVESLPFFEMSVAHYYGRGFKTEDEVTWITRARDLSIEESGYEKAGFQNCALGWGALTERRADECYGDPITGITSDIPDFNMHILPNTIEAENYDYFVTNGNGKTYYDSDAGNTGNEYRTDEDVDIEESDEGGYHVSSVAPSEWLTYTVYVPETRTYSISVRYSANGTGGALGFSFGGEDETGEVSLATTNGWQNWTETTIAQDVVLEKGVQSMRLNVGGSASVLNVNSISIDTLLPCGDPQVYETIETFEAQTGEFKYSFEVETSGVVDNGVIGLSADSLANSFSAFASIVQFSSDGTIKARNGDAYEANEVFNWASDKAYDIVMTVDIPNKTYSVTAAESGETAIVIATDYAFRSDWEEATYLDRAIVKTANCPLVITNSALEEILDLPIYTVTASATEGGIISSVGSTEVEEGTTVDYTITANSGYEITDVLVDGVSVGAVATYSFVSVTANHTIDAQFGIYDTTTTAVYDMQLTSSIMLFPNPIETVLYVKVPKATSTTYEIISINGRTLKFGEMAEGYASIDVSEFSKGVYYIKIISDGKTALKRFVKL